MQVSWAKHVPPTAKEALFQQMSRVASALTPQEVVKLVTALSKTGLRYFELPDEARRVIGVVLERLDTPDGQPIVSTDRELIVPLLMALGRLEAHWSHDFSPSQRRGILLQLESILPTLRRDELAQLIYG